MHAIASKSNRSQPLRTSAEVPATGGRRTMAGRSAQMTESERLALDNERMAERLAALKAQMAARRQQFQALRSDSASAATHGSASGEPRATSAPPDPSTGSLFGSVWRSGAAAGGLSSHARSILHGKKSFLRTHAIDSIEFLGSVPSIPPPPPKHLPPLVPASAATAADEVSGASAATRPRPPSAPRALTPSSARHRRIVRSESASMAGSDENSHAAPPSVPVVKVWHRPVEEEDHDTVVQLDQPVYEADPARFELPAPDLDQTVEIEQLSASRAASARRMTSFQSVHMFRDASEEASASLPPMVDEDNDNAVEADPWGGSFNEAANQRAFSDAVNEWRKGGSTEEKEEAPAAAEDHFVGGGGTRDWFAGSFDEAAEQRAFANAVVSWRRGDESSPGGAVEGRARPTTSATCSAVGTEHIAATTSMLADVKFTPSMSLLEQLLLRKLRAEQQVEAIPMQL
ncbi:hypothetical protein BC828DRAFT_375586 [Blastocladiella britannica]|nr:hypothetical protein BC828DRAFT_375586 [Blastocladiella britannica]